MNQPPSLNKALAGDRQALEDLARHCHPPVFGYLFRLCGSRELAQDLAQDTLLRMFESLDTYRMRPGAGFMSWVFRIARNRFLDNVRGRREVPLPDDAPGPDMTSAAALAGVEADGLRAAMGRLSPADRELIALRWFHGFSHREIGSITGAKPAVVKSRLNAALARLRKQYGVMEKKGNGHGEAVDTERD